MNERPSLADLAAIVAHRSFRKAADEAGLSPSTLSHMMRLLEARMGVRLLHRTTRSVSPTEAGVRLLERLRPVLQDLERPPAQATAPLRRDDGQRPCRADLPGPGEGSHSRSPNQFWVADLTYVAIPGGFVYLAAILDAWSRKVVSYAISRSIGTRIALAALKAAIRNRAPPPGCIHHSDCGCNIRLRYTETCWPRTA